MITLNAKPNRCHTKLAELERAGKRCRGDAKHRRPAPDGQLRSACLSYMVPVHRNICQTCGAVYSAEWICSREHEDAAGVPVLPRVRWSHQARCGALRRAARRVMC